MSEFNALFEGYGPNFYDISPFNLQLIQLIAKGIISLGSDYHFRDSGRFTISREAQFYLSKIIDDKYKLPRKKHEALLKASKPDKTINYEHIVQDEYIACQIACVSRYLEFTQKNEPKVKSLKAFSKLLNADFGHIDSLMNLIIDVKYRSKDSFQDKLDFEKGIDYNYSKFILSFINKKFFFATLLKHIASFDFFISLENFKKYISFCDGLSFTKYLEDDELVLSYLQLGLDFGLLEFAGDYSSIKGTGLLGNILNGKLVKESKTKEKALKKPLIVQPNFEILLNNTAELEVISKLVKFSTLSKIDKMLHFNMDKDVLIKALNKGVLIEDILNFLQTHYGMQLRLGTLSRR
ncbi:MAG: hypothetical protein ABIA04_03325 [Pseudomonadota bacterium]